MLFNYNKFTRARARARVCVCVCVCVCVGCDIFFYALTNMMFFAFNVFKLKITKFLIYKIT